MLVLLTNIKFRVFSFYLSWYQIQSIFCVIWCLVSMLVSGYYTMLRKHSRFRGKEEYIAELSKVHAKQISYQCFLTSIFPEDIFIKTLLSILTGAEAVVNMAFAKTWVENYLYVTLVFALTLVVILHNRNSFVL